MAVAFFLASAGAGNSFAASFNGAADNQRDDKGYYYAITGGQFPTGTTPNGDNASGGTFRFLTDDPLWGYTTGVWHKDDWYPDNASLGLTLKNGSTIVYDNNGLEPGAATPADPDYYDYTSGFPVPGAGAVTAYSMSNNYDWIYSGYFKLTQDTTVTQLIGYFAYNTNPLNPLTAGFDPADPNIQFNMNIFSNVSGDLLPTNTGSFAGDVFSSDLTAGGFSFSDTSFDRVGSSSTQDIYRLVYTLDNPLTLQAGVYWFSHDAEIVPSPAASIAGVAMFGMLALRRGRRSVELA